MQNKIHKIVKSVMSPLHFFLVIAIFLIGAIGYSLSYSKFSEELTSQFIFFSGSTVWFLIILVTFLIIKYPKNLTFDKESHIQVLQFKLTDNESNTEFIPNVEKQIELPKNLLPLPNPNQNQITPKSKGKRK